MKDAIEHKCMIKNNNILNEKSKDLFSARLEHSISVPDSTSLITALLIRRYNTFLYLYQVWSRSDRSCFQSNNYVKFGLGLLCSPFNCITHLHGSHFVFLCERGDLKLAPFLILINKFMHNNFNKPPDYKRAWDRG